MDAITLRLDGFSAADLAAFAVLLIAWQGVSWAVERTGGRPSTYRLMERYRRHWLEQMVTRQPRIFDAQVLASLQQTASFFSSASLIALGGGIALLGRSEQAVEVFSDLAGEAASRTVIQEKLIVVLLILAVALLRFIWSVRLYGYQAVVMSAVPNDASDEAYRTARRAAELHIYASRSFNRGLRALYFSLAALPWLAGWVPMLLATAITFGIIVRREFHSASRAALL